VVKKRIELQMPGNKKIFLFLTIACCVGLVAFYDTGCKVSYGFHDRGSIPDSTKTVKINIIENRARYINPQLSQQLTDKLRQKIVSQTKLVQTNKDDAHWEITAYISDYSVTTSGISNQQTATNRLNVSVHVTKFDHLANTQDEFDVSHGFDFSANKSLSEAESLLTPDIIRNMTDEIFNHIFSSWK